MSSLVTDIDPITINEVLGAIDKVRFDSMEPIVIKDISFMFFTSPSQEDESPAFYYASTVIRNGWDVYIHENLPESVIRRYLFHEILEVILAVRDRTLAQEAHNAALELEEIIFGPRKGSS
jgi:hypothetical protein